MANGTKEYVIKINGVEQSIKDVNKLAESLEKLDEAAAGTGSGSSSSMSSDIKQSSKAVDELSKKYEKLNNIISGEKDEIMEVNRLIKDATKAREVGLAAQRLEADEYGNTLVGLRQKLSDIKKAMTELDVDSNEFATMQKSAGELNSKILELEKGMGDFRRQVGNYASAAEGFKSVTVAVGGVNREFSSVRDATKQLEAEIRALSIAGKEDTQEFKNLTNAYDEFNKSVQRANSAVSDLKASSAGMDALLDMGQSIGAIGQVTQGFSAFFGSSSEIEKSIQKLMGLMSVMQGIEKLQQQMVTSEGLGAWLSKASEGVEKFISKLTGAKVATETMAVAEGELATSAGVAAAAEAGLAASEDALTLSSTKATTSTNALAVSQGKLAKSALATKGGMLALGLALATQNPLIKQLNISLDWVTEKFEKLWDIVGKVQAILPKMIVPKLFKDESEYKGFIEDTNDALEARLKYIQTLRSMGSISESQANEMELAARIKEAADAIEGLKRSAGDTEFGKELQSRFVKPTKEATEYIKNAFDASGNDIRSQFEKLGDDLNDWVGRTTKIESNAQFIVAQFTKSYEKAMNTMKTDTKAGQKAIMELYKTAMNNELLNSLLNHPEKWIDDEGTIAALKRMWTSVQDFASNMSKYDPSAGMADKLLSRYESLKPRIQQLREELESWKKYEQSLTGSETKDGKNLKAVAQATIKGIEDEIARELKSKNAGNKKIVESDRDLYRLRVMAMKEGLQKTLAQLDIQRQEELKKWKGNNEAIALINKNFNQQEYDAKREWYQRMNDLALNEAAETIRIEKERLDRMEDEQANTLANMKKNLSEYYTGSGNAQEQTSANYNEQGDYFEERMKAFDNYYKERIAKQKEFNQRIYEEDKALIEKEVNQLQAEETENYRKHYEELEKAYLDALDNLEKLGDNATEEDKARVKNLNDSIEEAVKNHEKRVYEITKQGELKLEQIKTKHREDDLNAEKEYLDDTLSEYRDFYKHISDVASRSPIYNKAGFINLKKTKENDKAVLAQFETLLGELNGKRKELNENFKNGIIDQETYDSTVKEFNSLSEAAKSGMDKVEDEMKGRFGKFWEQVNQWVQYAAQNAQQMLSMLWQMNDANHEAMMEELQNQIDAYQDKYDELEEIQRKHADNVTSIEEKLATARGDRRERLIDQLNSEMEARRKALAEEKKIEQEKNKLQKQKDDEELAQRKKQKERDRISAIINTAMAVSNALAVSPWWLAIVQASIAAAMGAAQVSVINSTKYADGGVLVGRSHAQGGIPVLGGRAEVEGGEFVVNKRTTANNVEVLDFINSRKKKLDLNDFVTFYGTPIKRNIQNAGMKFANGGQIPSLNTDFDMTDRLAASFEAYAQRPVVVSIVDIIDKEADIRQVQTLAGL